MDLWQLKKRLKAILHPFKNEVKIFHSWELLKMRYINDLEVRNADHSYQIKQTSNKWKVVSMERCSIIEEKIIKDENEACLYFLELIERIYTNDR